MSKDFDYYCTECYYRFTGSLKSASNCPVCKSEKIGLLPGSIRIGGGNYKHPIHSDAMAVNPSQVKEHMEKFPDIKLDEQCRPIFDNYGAHQRYLDATGFQKLPQKIRTRGKRIA